MPRERSDEPVAWLVTVPYSREVHLEWVEASYNGYRPSDPVKRAGQFFYLRPVGCGLCGAERLRDEQGVEPGAGDTNKIGRLEEFAARFDDVVLENLDWSEAFEKYDGPETVFYCDPPYVGSEGYYPVSEIDHGAFVEALGEWEGSLVVSYAALPDGVDDYRVVGRGKRNYMGNGKSGSAKRTREHLVMNFE